MFDPRKPSLKRRITDGSGLGVFWLALGNVTLVETAVAAGAEAIVIDMQHGLFDRATLEAAIGCVPSEVPCLVRTADDTSVSIGTALDAGAEGVIVPLVESARQAAAAARKSNSRPAPQQEPRRLHMALRNAPSVRNARKVLRGR